MIMTNENHSIANYRGMMKLLWNVMKSCGHFLSSTVLVVC